MCPYSQAIKKANYSCQYHTNFKKTQFCQGQTSIDVYTFSISDPKQLQILVARHYLFPLLLEPFPIRIKPIFQDTSVKVFTKIHYMYVSLYQRPELVALAVSVDTSRISHFFVLELKKTSRIWHLAALGLGNEEGERN